MADPLDVLRRRGDSAQPDPAFRSALMAELRRAMTRGDAHLSPLDIGTEPAPLEVVVSPSPSPSTPSSGPSSGRSRRYVAIGAAAAAVVALVVTGILVTRDDDVEPAAGLPVATDATSSGTAVETTIVETVAPTTVAPTSTAAPTTNAPITVPPGDDAELAEALLLEEPEYAEGWFALDLGVNAVPTKVVQLDAAVADGLPSCAGYVDVVFEGPRRPASVAYRWFFHPDPAAQMVQYVVVLPDEAAATAMFDATEDPNFVDGCLSDYIATFPNEYCCDVNVPASPLSIEGKVEAPAITIAGDQSSVRAYVGSWIDEQGVSHGPEQWVSATVRVGRSVMTIDALVEGEGAVPVIGLDEFEQIVARLVDKAEEALGD